LRVEGFSFSLDILYGGLGISKKRLVFSAVFILFLVIKIPDPYPDPDSISPDPQQSQEKVALHFYFDSYPVLSSSI
jgi:hypothetical protein